MAAGQIKPSSAQLLRLYADMRLIREVELRLSLLFGDGEIPGFIHLSIGQEAVAVGVAGALRTDDTLASNHRGHGHAIAKGLDLSRFFLEIMGRSEGYCGGRGGSMHVADMSVGMLGANGIVGAGLPIAVGSALAHQLRKTGAIACVFFGDGALAEGVLHESFNMAALWKLPILFVCENNGWSEFSPAARQLAAEPSKLAETFNIPAERVNGNDIVAVREAGFSAIEAVRAGGGPRLVECKTTRVRGHFEGDPREIPRCRRIRRDRARRIRSSAPPTSRCAPWACRTARSPRSMRLRAGASTRRWPPPGPARRGAGGGAGRRLFSQIFAHTRACGVRPHD